MILLDLAKMPLFNEKVPNGTHSVSEGKVFYGIKTGQSKYAVAAPQCKEHGALLCVARTEHGNLWRCEVCNEGCYTRFEVDA